MCHWIKTSLVQIKTSRHYLNQCRNIVNWNLGNKVQCNFHSWRCTGKCCLENGSHCLSLDVLNPWATRATCPFCKVPHLTWLLDIAHIYWTLEVPSLCLYRGDSGIRSTRCCHLKHNTEMTQMLWHVQDCSKTINQSRYHLRMFPKQSSRDMQKIMTQLDHELININSPYIMVEYSTILNTTWKEESLNFVQTMHWQKTPHTSLLLASFSEFFGERYRDIFTELNIAKNNYN